MRKIAIIFPGIGYHSDKPLLYYGKKLAIQYGYEIIEVNYSGFTENIRGDEDKMKETFQIALEQAEEILAKESISQEDDILMISKSIGTIVAACYEAKHGLEAKHIYFTPLVETFRFMRPESGIIFHGTADPWADTKEIMDKCADYRMPLFLTEDGNHSLEKGLPLMDVRNLSKIILNCQLYLSGQNMWTFVGKQFE